MIDIATIGILLSTALALMAWSILYRVNDFYATAESLTMGVYSAFMWVEGLGVLTRRYSLLFDKGQLRIDLVILLILGLLYYSRLFKGKEWPSRIPMAVLAGIASGMAVKGTIYSQILQQVTVGSFVGKTMFDTFNNILIIVLTFTAVSYMIHTREHKGILSISTRIGRLGLMAAFGWEMGVAVMSSLSFGIGQAGMFVTSPGIYVTVPALLLILVDFLRRSR